MTLILATPIGRTLHEEHVLLRDQEQKALSPEVGREAMVRHPVDYLAAAYVAAALYQAGDVKAKDFLNHALLLHPTHPELHRLAARILLRNGRERQALLEYQLAIASTFNPVEVIRELIHRFPQVDKAVSALPVQHLVPGRVAHILIDEGRSDVALPYLKRVVGADPDDVPHLKLLAQVAATRKDTAAAELAATRLATVEPSQESFLALARVLHERKSYPAAEKAARRAIDRRGPVSVMVEAHLLLADILIGAQKWQAAREQLIMMRESPELYVLARRDIHRRLAVVEDSLGNAHQADWERQRARAP
jgi:predicted Zn-dependent protease